MRDDQRADYERMIAEQAALIVSLRELIEFQAGRIAVLEKAAGQDSSNSSKPPSSDGVGPRKKRAERRAEARAVGRKPVKQPGAPGVHLRRRDPDVSVVHGPFLDEVRAQLGVAAMLLLRIFEFPHCRSPKFPRC